ncbi:MAG TPA: ABC transporter permease [Actinomycetota bacterium]|jgi:spermidine/putrescine transport system permease protein
MSAVGASRPVTVDRGAEETVGALPPTPRKRRRWTRYILPVYSIGVLLYLLLPILVMILYGFNNSGFKRVSFRWQGFTIEWYKKLFAIPDLTNSLKNSLVVAVISTLIATVLGTMMALALVRYRFRAKGTSEFVMFLNIAAPEIVLGASLLSLFITFGIPRGMLTIIIAHVMFNIAFVTITVRARLAGLDLTVEEAAKDLGATPWVTFWKVTFPIIFPGILAGALLAFALSIDDFIITNFVAGSTQTFPLWVYGTVKVGIPPQVFVMGTIIFLVGVVIAIANVIANRKAAPRAL